jgi:hypothetical protein
MLADGHIDAENGRNLKRILEEFSALCYIDGDRHEDGHPINQQILVNFGKTLSVPYTIQGWEA